MATSELFRQASPIRNSQNLALQFVYRFVPWSAVVLIVASAFYFLDKSSTEVSLRNRQSDSVESIVRETNFKLRHFAHEIRGLSGHRELTNYLNTGGEENRLALEKEFLFGLRNSDEIDQIRLLDINGKEEIRVEKAAGKPRVVNREGLQNKRRRYYISDIQRIAPGSVYVSRLDLNVEHGEITYPLKPTLRMAIRVFSDNEGNQKLLIVNFLAQSLLQLDIPGIDGQQLLVDSDGYYLKAFNSDEAWGFQIEAREQSNFGRQYPQIWDSIQGLDSGQANSTSGFMSFKKIYLVSDVDRERAIQFGDTDYHWLLISFASPVDRFTSPVVRRIVLWSLGMMLVLALVCYLTAERRVRGVLAAKRLADSESKYRQLVESSKDLIWEGDTEARFVFVNPA